MVLRRDDFAAWRINWNDKAQNLLEIAEELNIPLGTALTRMRSAMAKLKKLLSEPEP